MSDLKYRSIAELRAQIAQLAKWRADKEREAQVHDARAEQLRAAAQEEEDTASELRHRAHNMGQKEAAARMWLARKELGEA